MKKLLFAGLMSVSFMFMSGKQQDLNLLFKDFPDTDVLSYLSSEGQDFSTITCSQIHALSQDAFDTLIEEIQQFPSICSSRQDNIFEGTPEYAEWEERLDKSFAQVEFILSIIHKCRSIIPAYNKQAIKILREISDEEFEELLAQLAATDYIHLNDFQRIFMDSEAAYLLHPNNVEKLRALRAELRTEK